jgi:hypothetical protein
MAENGKKAQSWHFAGIGVVNFLAFFNKIDIIQSIDTRKIV